MEWLKSQLIVANEDESYYGGLVRDSTYTKVVDLYGRHRSKIRICGSSKRWLVAEVLGQVQVVRHAMKR